MTIRKSVLFIDDDESFVNRMIASVNGHFVLTPAHHYDQAFDLLAETRFDVAVCDIFIERESCVREIARLRATAPNCKLIILTGNPVVEHLISFINLKVDGIIEKPCSARNFIDRVTEILESPNAIAATTDQQLNLQLVPEKRAILCGNQIVQLTKIEFSILNHLFAMKGAMATRQQLADQVWPKTKVSKHTLDTHIYNIKRKAPALEERLNCVHSVGYIFE